MQYISAQGTSSMEKREAEFKTLDGLTLRGDLYPAQSSVARGPAVVITPGINCVKEMFVPEIAQYFQKADITALVYDPRSIGISDGLPRNEIDPARQASDFSDAVTYVRDLPNVDPSQVGIWSMSFSACIAISAAALDPRVRFCINVCPTPITDYDPSKFPKVLVKLQQERESQLAGNPPLYVPLVDVRGGNIVGFGDGVDKEEGIQYLINAKMRGAPSHNINSTFLSYYRMMMWHPEGIMSYLKQTPVMTIVPEFDLVSPPERQIKMHESFPEPKLLHIARGKGHLNVLSGDDFPALAEMQVKFIKDSLSGWAAE
ncbi:hypothetical protein L249_1575 [Ophiocordyceps polyrhachis-furcata BCC 54312]|uniref:Uncharacterized protein n=1 Tax=Ophiocordyceps polyrhachis-furcata BCC 54312 TaxID=1330021 RepID=A0A367L4B5_9HYPO|nr:hypothetical protein L249_1575 [Ophiocordyceps polyrhachis-furcata BCC 54312]